MKSTSRRFGPSILITAILLLAFLSCEKSLRVDAKRLFRPERQDAAKLELAQSLTAHQLSKTTPGAFIAGNTEVLGKRDGLVGKQDEEVGFHPQDPACLIKRGNRSLKSCDDNSVGKSTTPKINANSYRKTVQTSQLVCSTTSACTTVNCLMHQHLH